LWVNISCRCGDFYFIIITNLLKWNLVKEGTDLSQWNLLIYFISSCNTTMRTNAHTHIRAHTHTHTHSKPNSNLMSISLTHNYSNSLKTFTSHQNKFHSHHFQFIFTLVTSLKSLKQWLICIVGTFIFYSLLLQRNRIV